MDCKKLLATLMLIFCLCPAVTRPSFGFERMGFTVYVNPQHNSARVNNLFSINVSIANVSELGLWAYEFKLYYNKSLLEPLSAEIPANHFLEPTLSPDNILIVDPGTLNHTEGTVSFAALLVSPEPGKTGSGTLANITFLVIAPGECTLGIRGYTADEPKFFDGNGDLFPSCEYSIVEGCFEGIPPPPLPIPPPTPKAGWETVAFDFMGIYGYLTFPEECHPNETLTHELTLAAEPDGIHVNDFRISVSCNTSSEEVILYSETTIQNEDIPEDWSLNKSITLTIPSDAYGKLHCVIEASTYKRFATCDSALRLYTTQVRTMTYEKLLEAYSQLLNQYNVTVEELNHWLAEYQELNNTYNELLADYNSLKSAYQSLEASYNSLNSSYNSLRNEYSSLQVDYNSLLNAFNLLNSTYVDLFSNYTGLVSDFELLQDELDSLQTSYDNLLEAYDSLNSTYYTLLNECEPLKSTNDALMNEIRNAKTLWGILLAATMTTTASTIYLLIKGLGERKRKIQG
jgi:prefoldin subunit 5